MTKTRTTTWPAQIAVVLVLLAAGMASGASGFLSGNSPLGENAWEAVVHRAEPSLSGGTHRGCGDLKLCDATGLFVAPANASGRSSYTLIDQGNPAVRELRRRYLGETPRRGSPTYRAVVERMQNEGHIRLNQATGQLELRGQINGAEVWRPLSSPEINMGHRVDAVRWWNETGRFHGARSPQAREFMLNPDNYILQFESPNKSLGATLRHQGNEYLPPPIASLRIVE
jgi:hypothetical protein